MKILFSMLLRKQLLTIHKIFVRSYLDYADIIYDKPFNGSFKEKFEKVQYSAAVIMGVTKGTSRVRLYKELGLESFSDRRCYRKLVFFYKKIFTILIASG